jgi:hypothetical protein
MATVPMLYLNKFLVASFEMSPTAVILLIEPKRCDPLHGAWMQHLIQDHVQPLPCPTSDTVMEQVV